MTFGRVGAEPGLEEGGAVGCFSLGRGMVRGLERRIGGLGEGGGGEGRGGKGKG